MIIKSRNAVPALLLRAGSSRYVVPALSLEQQLRGDVAVEVHALRQRRDDVEDTRNAALRGIYNAMLDAYVGFTCRARAGWTFTHPM